MAIKKQIDQFTLNQIFTKNIRFLLDSLLTQNKSMPHYYANITQENNTAGVFYDYTIDAFNGLPNFEDIEDVARREEVITGGVDLTPKLTEIDEHLKKLDEQYNALNTELTTLQGVVNSLESRISALEVEIP